ncbi:MAG: peptidoglycan editing factor PgeF [Clostridia bacterium]|nr:peptidoglycan editing factor PgeF [Clostridia bacterium]
MQIFRAENRVEFIRSENITSIHAFSTRVGGVSELPHTSSLNLAFGRGDERDTVLENLSLFAAAVGFDAERLVSVHQIHSADVRLVDGSHAGQGYIINEAFECDGYVTNTSGVAVGVKTADCVPILMEGYDRSGAVCCVGAAHAGWRGTVSGIAVKCLEQMRSLGTERVRVAIGPAICGKCFEVRSDFYDAVSEILGEELTAKYLLPDGKMTGVWHTDLRRMNKDFLVSAGVAECDIDISEDCTCCLPERYFSHRFSGGKRGTQLSVIVMP